MDSGDAIPELEDHLGYWLRRVSNQVSGDFARALASRQTAVAEWVVLRLIHGHDGIKPAELADTIGMTRGAISKTLEKLEAKGWITIVGNQDDGRVRLLSLTEEGKVVLPELARLAQSNDDRYFGHLDANERAGLMTVLRKLSSIHDWNNVPID